MSLTEKTACLIANKIKKNMLISSDEYDIIVYGATGILLIIINLIWITIISSLLGCLFESILVIFSIAVLRKYSGGAHASSPRNCITMGTTFSVLAGLMVKYVVKNDYDFVLLLSITVSIWSMYVIIKKAPVDSAAKPINSLELKKKFRKTSIIILIIYFVFSLSIIFFNKDILRIIDNCFSFGIMIQVFMLTDTGKTVIYKIDNILNIRKEDRK